MQGEIAEILSGPDYFRCERNHTRMRKIACLERQEEGIPVGIGYKREMPSECADCPQGREIKAELQKKDQSTEDSVMRKTGICSECKKEKEIAARGMCKICYDTWRRKELSKHRSYSLATMGVNYGEEVSVTEETKDIDMGKMCLVMGCARPQVTKGRCKKHYNEAYLAEKGRMKRAGIMGPVAVADLRYLKNLKDTIEAHDSVEADESIETIESASIAAKAIGKKRKAYVMNEKVERPEPWPEPPERESSPVGEAWIIVDFEQFPELLEQVEERARKDFRPIEHEVLYLVKQGLGTGL